MIESLRTDLFELRPIRADDADEFVRVHEASREHFGPWSPKTESGRTLQEVFEKELSRAESGRVEGTEARLVASMPDGRIAGFFSLSQIYRGCFQNAYAGWRVSADQTGRGIATLGVIALLDLAFAPEPEGLGLHRVQANIVPDNHASLRVAEKAGFRIEGRARDYLLIDGVWRDHLMLAKLGSEHATRYLR